MAGNLPVPNGVELKITWAQGALPSALNILHFHNSLGTVFTQARADAIGTIVRTAFSSSLHTANVWTGVNLASVQVRDMTSNSFPWWQAAGAAVPGTSAANPLPAATALVISVLTGFRGRSYNGRIYLWGFTEDANDTQGGAAPAAAAQALAFISSISGPMSSGQGCDLAVLSRFTTPPGATVPTERNPPLLTPATNVVLKDTRWDVQRRRAVPGI